MATQPARSKTRRSSQPYGASDFVSFIHEWGHPEWAVLAIESPLEKVAALYYNTFRAVGWQRAVSIRPSRRNDSGMAEWIPFVQTKDCNWIAILRTMCLPIETGFDEAAGDARLLSKKLHTRAVAFMGEDTSYAMQCDLFDNGKTSQTRCWENQGNDADGLLTKLGLYFPACYSQHRGKIDWLSACESSLERIQCADLILPSD